MEGIQIQTTQNVALEYIPASLGDRILAYLLDSLVKVAWMIIMIFLLGGLARVMGTEGQDSYVIAGLVLLVLPILFYGLLCEIFMNGQSIGKRAMNIRVVMLDGSQPSIAAYLIRWLMCIIDFGLFSGVIALVAVAASTKGQRLGDLAAGTSVVKLRPPVGLDELTPPALSSQYRVSYPEVSFLKDHDITIIKQVLSRPETPEKNEMLNYTAQKTKEAIGIQTINDARTFLQVVIADYTFVTNQQEV